MTEAYPKDSIMNKPPWSFDDQAQELKKNVARLSDSLDYPCWKIPFFGDKHTVSEQGVYNDQDQEVNPAISVVLMTYVLRGEARVDDGLSSAWISYRECRGAGPLMGYFQENTGKTIEWSFAGNMETLKAAGQKMGGVVITDDGSFDLSLRFEALPGIPVLLRFNDQDETFPASCQILFPESAQNLLDIRCLGVLGTYLTGRLIVGPPITAE